MASGSVKRPCRFCREWFSPDPRVGDRQYACATEACRAQRKAFSQAAWLKRHPGYFRGRAVKHRRWREAHPDAQRRRRQGDPALRERERLARARRRKTAATRRAVEQDAMALQLLGGLEDRYRVSRAVEQDEMTPHLLVAVGVASRLAPAVAQDPIAGALLHWHDCGRRVVEGAHAATRSP